jgi:metallo-beta-lactamase family protein
MISILSSKLRLRLNIFRNLHYYFSIRYDGSREKSIPYKSISYSKNTILAVGYCAPMTLGARILRGDKEISIFGNLYKVNADIERLDSYSGHADYDEMIRFLECQDKQKIKHLVLVHGELKSQEFFRDRLGEKGYQHITIPQLGEVISI